MKKQKISVKEIADRAGTSIATVSRVINQNGRFSKETEEKIRKIIEETGYQPNQLARGLRANHTRVIGILVPNIEFEFYSSIAKAVQSTLLEQNYMSLICDTDEKEEQAKRYVEIFNSQQVDGIIYIGNNEMTNLPDMPIVYIDRDPRDQQMQVDDNFVLLECDNIQGGYLAGKELVEKGAKCIAYVSSDIKVSTHKKRLQGLRWALEEHGMEVSDDHVIETKDIYTRTGLGVMKKIRDTMPEVDGVFFSTDLMAIGALNYLQKTGVNVPEQMKIVGFDNHSMSEIMDLTTIRQPVAELGRVAALSIIDMIEGKDIPQKRQRLSVELVARSTT